VPAGLPRALREPTPASSPTRTRTGAATATRTLPAPPTATRPDEASEISCGGQLEGILEAGDEDFFGDGTRSDLYDLHLAASREVSVAMDGDFETYLYIFPAGSPDDPLAEGDPPVVVELAAGHYVIVANNFDEATEPLPYPLSVDCGGADTETPTRTATQQRTSTLTVTATESIAPPTPTPTRTRAGTPTVTARATPTATSAGCVIQFPAGDGATAGGPGQGGCADLVADAIEVVQTVQDLDNSVRLVVGKRTFVRFHVHSTSGAVRATARLTVGEQLDDPLAKQLIPINPGGPSITVVEQPDRKLLNSAFLFELPAGFTGHADRDSIVLEAEVIPGGAVAESDFGNNSETTIVTFRYVPKLQVVLYHVGYNGVPAPTGAEEPFHADRLLDWLEAAYPVAEVEMFERSLLPYRAVPGCERINVALLGAQIYNSLYDSRTPSTAIYYGMVFDRGDPSNFVRGSTPLPLFASSRGDRVSCGPSGDPAPVGFAWDTDGSYGDWYGGHEIGHAHRQLHPGICSDEAHPILGPGPHHPNGLISETSQGRDAVFGFDARTPQRVYAPNVWTDVMTYCSHQWISDLTYHGLMDRMRPPATTAAAALITIRTDRLLVAGTVDAENGTVDLEPLFVLPDTPDPEPAEEGDFAIVLRDGSGRSSPATRCPARTRGWAAQRIGRRRSIAPAPVRRAGAVRRGTARVDVEGPGIFGTIQAGMAAPR
jgi:hypothetical protein